MSPYHNDAQYMETPYNWNGYVGAPDTPHNNTDVIPYLGN